MNDTHTNLITILLIVVVVAGFAFVLSSLSEVKEDTQNLSFNLELLYERTVGDTIAPGNNFSTSTDNNVDSDLTTIKTAILFEAKSSPLLSPQTDITVIVDQVSKTEDGTVTASIKAYTSKSQSYSALQPSYIFKLIDFSGPNQSPLKTQGSFDSIPPQSVAQGQVTFKAEEGQEEIILQIEGIDGTTHYRFNFEDKTYEEAILG